MDTPFRGLRLSKFSRSLHRCQLQVCGIAGIVGEFTTVLQSFELPRKDIMSEFGIFRFGFVAPIFLNPIPEAKRRMTWCLRIVEAGCQDTSHQLLVAWSLDRQQLHLCSAKQLYENLGKALRPTEVLHRKLLKQNLPELCPVPSSHLAAVGAFWVLV